MTNACESGLKCFPGYIALGAGIGLVTEGYPIWGTLVACAAFMFIDLGYFVGWIPRGKFVQ